ncbi:MAG: LCP family protein [Acidimicrobiales bacterium]|nr:LCP family protein [Acidimicrobiales bacterium]
MSDTTDDPGAESTSATPGDPPTDEQLALSALVDDVAQDLSTFVGPPSGPTPAIDDGSTPPSGRTDPDRTLTPDEIDALLDLGSIVVRKRGDVAPTAEASPAPTRAAGRASTDGAAAGAVPAQAAATDLDEDDGAGLALLASGASAPRRRATAQRSWRDEPSGWWRWGFPATILVLVLVVPVLVWVGYRTVLESNDSTRVQTDVAESDPGWQALVEPTETMAVGFVDADGALAAVSVLSLSGESSGGIVTMHPNTVGPVPGTDENTVPAKAYADGGAQGMADMVGAMLNAGMGEHATLTPDQLGALLAPVAPLTFDNGDPVRAGEVRFDRGELNLAADQAGLYLTTRNTVSDDLNRMDRYEWFWKAWLAAIAAKGEGALPGETDSGLGYFLSRLADRQVQIATLPVEPASLPGGSEFDKVYVPLEPQTDQLMVTVIPFPVGAPPGARVRIQLFDGTGQLNHGLPASPLLVYAGGEITSIGNATSFDNAVTKVIYYDDAMRPAAETMRDALGVGEVEKSEAQGSAVDVTVILGQDWAALPVAQQQVPLTQGTAAIVGTSTSIVSGASGG